MWWGWLKRKATRGGGSALTRLQGLQHPFPLPLPPSSSVPYPPAVCSCRRPPNRRPEIKKTKSFLIAAVSGNQRGRLVDGDEGLKRRKDFSSIYPRISIVIMLPSSAIEQSFQGYYYNSDKCVLNPAIKEGLYVFLVLQQTPLKLVFNTLLKVLAVVNPYEH